MDGEGLHAAQAQRWRDVDPLLPAPAAPRPDPLTVPDGAGWTHRADLDPDSFTATWTALRNHTLTAHVAGEHPAAALGALLDGWDAELGPPDDEESVAEVVWPSRDTSPVLALTRRGFTPAVVMAAGRPGRVRPVAVPGLTVRPLTDADLDIATGFALEIVRYDGQFGAIGERPSTVARLAGGFTDHLRHDTPTAWLAVLDGRPVGMCAVDLPQHATSADALCSASRIGYLDSMYVDPTARSTGIASALHVVADAALHAAGTEVVLLHHAVPNPRSTPFWYRHGYRPLWTHWQRRPALRRRPAAPER